ncbi:DR2241 family protein [Halobacteria archaeon AArc-dxtr1]|nr:DR2241 family protein [Halobacteria archaeon AArc-dxtr1]
MALSDQTVATLRDAADDGGVAFDGLRVETDEAGYAVETPAGAETGLSADDLPAALEAVATHVTNWRYWQHTVGGEGTARRAFLRWCERAPIADASPDENGEDLAVPDRYGALRDGIVREWGQLQITARVPADDEHAAGEESADDRADDERASGGERTSAGERVYDLRHVADVDAERGELDVYDDPRAAREIATADEDGRYRPLKTAPTLASGWIFPDLSGAELVETVGFFYPATIQNWHREHRGSLDVDHWLGTAQRQTGIYDVIDELPREAVEWMAEACCVDSQCLRRREWQYEEGDELAVDGGDGAFPCREPCSLVVAAARKWAILESEEEKTWQLELTTSELHQLEALIDAVADGRTDEIREADVYEGANRYRARYLRAKRFEDGELPAVERDGELPAVERDGED